MKFERVPRTLIKALVRETFALHPFDDSAPRHSSEFFRGLCRSARKRFIYLDGDTHVAIVVANTGARTTERFRNYFAIAPFTSSDALLVVTRVNQLGLSQPSYGCTSANEACRLACSRR